MDRAIAAYLRRHYSLRIGLPPRNASASTPALPAAGEELTVETSGLDAASGLPRKAIVASEEIRQALGDPLESILEAVKTTLDHCSPELAADLMDRGMTLCGGGSRSCGDWTAFSASRRACRSASRRSPQNTLVKGLLICLEDFEQWRPARAPAMRTFDGEEERS